MPDPLLAADRSSLGALVAYYRARARLTQSGLAARTRTMSSTRIARIESGWNDGRLRRSIVLQLAQALDLDPWATDHLLYVAGCAPVLDYQRFAREIMTELGLGYRFDELTEHLYAHQSAAEAGPTARSRPEGDEDDQGSGTEAIG